MDAISPAEMAIRPYILQFTPPDVPEAYILRAAEKYYGLTGTAEPLEGERDRNLKLTDDDGNAYVIKLASTDEPPEITGFLVRALDHIARHAPGLPVPRHRQTKNGESSVRVGLGGGAEYTLRVLDYLPGERLMDLDPPTTDMLRRVGALQGDLTQALSGFFDPAARHFVAWDISNGLVLNPGLVARIDAELRPLADPLLSRLRGGLQDRLSGLRSQVIHADAHAGNILCDPARPDEIAGIIDFGDMVHAPVICDLGVSGASYLEYTDDILGTVAALVEGFHARFPLREDEIGVLHDLILVRLVLSLQLNAYRRSLDDCPGYIRDMYPMSIDNLRRYAAVDPDEAQARYRMACGFAAKTALQVAFPNDNDLAARRDKALSPSYHLFYQKPVQLVRGQGVWMWDADGKRYLDGYNNVASMGHCHPHIVGEVSRQLHTLNTHTRYLHDNIVRYAERLAETLPGDLGTCLLVCTGTEANDLAFQIARAVTGKTGAIVTQGVYHGSSISVTDLSPSDWPEGYKPDHVEVVDIPDAYRGRHGAIDDIGPTYAADVDIAIDALEESGHGVAMFVGEASFEGYCIMDAPDGYFAGVYARVRAAGGLVVADEVQSGMCRMGENMWAIMDSGVVPDIVTMGKPMGNGMPLAVVATTPAIAAEFAKHTSYFNTYGGNPVAAAAGNAVLDVVEQEDVLARVARSGRYLFNGLDALAQRHPLIGDVRGKGMFAGIELVTDRKDKTPAVDETIRVVEHMKDNGVLVARTGPHGNIVKIRPTLATLPEHVDILLDALERGIAAVG